MISRRTTMHGFWGISVNPSRRKTSVNFRCHKRNDRFRPYNALFNRKIFFCFSYLKDIRIKTTSFKKTCTKAFTASNCRVSKLNLAISVNKIRRTVIAKVVTRVNSSDQCCWLSHITILALHFSNSPCLFVLYLNTHWHSNTWCPLDSQWSTTVQELKSCLCCLICCAMESRKSFSYGWPLRSL